MQSKKLAGNKITESTQKYLDIAEIRDDIVVLKDGTLRAVLLVSSINFALKSEDEQNATIAAYVNFLNSLSYPIQIVIQSRKLNIDTYIEDLKKREREQTNELLKAQTQDYLKFVQELVDLGEIMTKRFYIVVPYDPVSDSQKTFWSRFGEMFSVAKIVQLSETRFQERREELQRRIDLTQSSLSSVGLNSVRMNTQSLIEMYYSTYNPKTSLQEDLPPLKDMRVE